MRAGFGSLVLRAAVFGLSWIGTHAFAKDMCHLLRTVRGEYLDVPCTKGTQEATTAGSFPSFADSFNLNPASIPTMRTPIGVEVIASNAKIQVSGSQYNYALIKGFQKIGAALSTDSDTTFFNHGLYQADQDASANSDETALTYTNTSSWDAVMPSINLGAAVAGLAGSKLEDYVLPSYGVLARYNRVSHKWGNGFGVSINSKYVTFGASAILEKNTDGSNTKFVTYTAGFKVGAFQADYTYLLYGKGSAFLTNGPTHIASAALRLKDLWLQAAHKRYIDEGGFTSWSSLAGAQYQISKYLSLGYLYNYIPGSHSLAMQIFLM